MAVVGIVRGLKYVSRSFAKYAKGKEVYMAKRAQRFNRDKVLLPEMEKKINPNNHDILYDMLQRASRKDSEFVKMANTNLSDMSLFDLLKL